MRRRWSNGYDWSLPTIRSGFDSRSAHLFSLSKEKKDCSVPRQCLCCYSRVTVRLEIRRRMESWHVCSELYCPWCSMWLQETSHVIQSPTPHPKLIATWILWVGFWTDTRNRSRASWTRHSKFLTVSVLRESALDSARCKEYDRGIISLDSG